MARFVRSIWHRFGAIAIPYWFSGEKWRARALLALTVLLLVGQVWTDVLFNEQSGEFTSALAAKEAVRFWHSIYHCVGVLIVAVPIYALYYYVRDKLGINWRRWLTDRFLDKYFSNRAFFELNFNANIDNPDQRLSEDIGTFTQKSLYFLLIMVGALIQLLAFCGVLWSISRTLVCFLVIYALVGTLVTAVRQGSDRAQLLSAQARGRFPFRPGAGPRERRIDRHVRGRGPGGAPGKAAV
jgi:vitamin B12/bleomycin/antimicrobial peptide transport system ATP-binding/permease protein